MPVGVRGFGAFAAAGRARAPAGLGVRGLDALAAARSLSLLGGLAAAPGREDPGVATRAAGAAGAAPGVPVPARAARLGPEAAAVDRRGASLAGRGGFAAFVPGVSREPERLDGPGSRRIGGRCGRRCARASARGRAEARWAGELRWAGEVLLAAPDGAAPTRVGAARRDVPGGLRRGLGGPAAASGRRGARAGFGSVGRRGAARFVAPARAAAGAWLARGPGRVAPGAAPAVVLPARAERGRRTAARSGLAAAAGFGRPGRFGRCGARSFLGPSGTAHTLPSPPGARRDSRRFAGEELAWPSASPARLACEDRVRDRGAGSGGALCLEEGPCSRRSKPRSRPG